MKYYIIKLKSQLILISWLLMIVSCVNKRDNQQPQIIEIEPATVAVSCYEEGTYKDSWAGYPAPKDIKYPEGKKNDFLIAVTNNPSFNIYQLMNICEIRTYNTGFLPESDYQKSKWVRKNYTPTSLHEAYIKLESAWRIVQRYSDMNLSDPEISKYMMKYDMFDTDKPKISNAKNPQLIMDLKRIPLQ